MKAKHAPLTQQHNEQRLRQLRLIISALSHAMLLGILALALAFDLLTGLSTQTFFGFCLFAVLTQGCFWLMFRSGLNLKCPDPSLTQLQMITAIVWFSMLISYLPELRGSLLILYIMVMLFGIFQLNMQEFAFLGLVSLICFGAVIASDLYLRPENVNLKLSLMQWLILASAQTWITLFATYVRRLSERLKRQRYVLQNHNQKIKQTNRELEQAMARLDQIAGTDELTGILNRRRFFQSARLLLSRQPVAQASAICMLDLDHFKQINDRFGHQAGDHVLEHFCRITAQSLRASDLFGRYGGEEFVLLLPNTNQESALLVAERIREAFSGYRFDDISPGLTLSVSIGMTLYRQGESLESALDRADKALYQAKSNGRNHTLYLSAAESSAQPAPSEAGSQPPPQQ